MNEQTSAANMQLNNLIEFRTVAYTQLGNARDALFELTDAVILMSRVNSFVELTLAPVFRRKWSSGYEALQDGRPDRKALLRLYVGQIPTGTRPILAGDHTAWPRVFSPALKGRTVEHQPTSVPGNRPITIGQGYSTLAWVPDAQGSWALPLLHERIAADEKPTEKAVRQLREVCQELSVRPLTLWDAEYGCAPFVLATADIPADKIMRLRPNLCLWGPPPPYGGKGRPRKHGDKFKLSDPATWGTPVESLEVDDPQLGPIRLSLWRDLRFRKAAGHPMTVVRIEQLQARGTRRHPKVIWLAWVGEELPTLAEGWRLYLRRFAVDHWYRFAKQRLHWTLPHVGTPEQSERWSDLMPLITWELWLAREIVADNPLPWQKRQVNLTPGRVCQGMAGLLVVIGTPAREPKPRGKSPGWPKGRLRTRRERYAVVKKAKKPKKKAT